MAQVDLQSAFLLENAVDPRTPEFADLMGKLMKPRADDRTRQDRLAHKGEFRYVLPCRGESEEERAVLELTPFVFAERANFRNGVESLALALADLLDLVVLCSNRRRTSPTLVVTAEAETLQEALLSAGPLSGLVHYCSFDNVADALLAVRPETVVFDHTTVNCPVDVLLNLAYRAGVQVVDGVFPYHVAGEKGWDVVSGLGKWSYTHDRDYVVVGPDNDCARQLKYARLDYKRFIDPKLWHGNSRKYAYELRKCRHGLATYRAVYVADMAGKSAAGVVERFKLPLCSSDDMVLVTINRDLAAGVFASRSTNAQELMSLEKNYCIEVRRDLFVSCVDFLIAKDRKADVVGEATRYVNSHNYVDLVDGVRIVRCPALGYADALCVSMVCALTAFALRYRLTAESIPDIQRSVNAAKMLTAAPMGALGRLAWLFGTYVSDAVGNVAARARDAAVGKLYATDYIPGVCYDVYMDKYYIPDADWYEPGVLEVEERVEVTGPDADDPFVAFLGNGEKTSAPNVVREKNDESAALRVGTEPYKHNVIPDPEVSLQHFYDVAFPGNSVTQIPNVSELRRVRDVNVNTEFYGKIEVNKDVAAPERLHFDMPVRTAALPVSRTPLLDAILASAKRNFNPPDLQMQSDPFGYARSLVRRFIDNAFVPEFRETIGKSYKKDMLTFNVEDYLAWRATRDKAYRSALEAECPEGLVELGLEKFDTIVKQRIKPKLSVSAQHELSQPQVIVSMSKKDTALFTSVFRVVFERFDNALRPEYKSAGRASDFEISLWLTEHKSRITSLAAVELDSTKYDKSQNLLARMIEACLFEELGLDPQVGKIFEDSYVGRVSSRALGLVFVLAYQMKSGAPDTMLGNIVYNAVSAGESIGWKNIALMIIKGDDNVVWLSHAVKQDTVVAKMSGLFNLEVKLITGSVLYFSSGYIVPVGEKVWFVPDPLKLAELLGESGLGDQFGDERFISFKDRVSAYALDAGIPRVLQELVRHRVCVPELDVVMAVDSYLSMAASREVYDRVVKGWG